jgi:hypothetical protein
MTAWIPKYKVVIDGHEHKFESWNTAHDFRLVMCDELHVGYGQPSPVSKVLPI